MNSTYIDSILGSRPKILKLAIQFNNPFKAGEKSKHRYIERLHSWCTISNMVVCVCLYHLSLVHLTYANCTYDTNDSRHISLQGSHHQ